jgi:hypothetical protein
MILAAALLLAAAAPAAAPAAATPEPATCLITGRQLDYKVVSETELLIRAGGRWHRSALPEACSGLKANMILVRREASPRLCANDLFEVRDNFTPAVFSLCRFGRFETLLKGAKP